MAGTAGTARTGEARADRRGGDRRCNAGTRPWMATTHENDRMQVKILDPRLGSEFPLPTYSTPGSAGLDLPAMVDEPLTLWPGEVKKIKTGLAIHIESRWIAGVIIPRSGLGSRGLVVGNTVGLIDSDYQGEILIAALNRSDEPILISPGDRIAQLVFIPVIHQAFEVVNEFSPSERGEGGFGSTGT